MRVCIIVNFLDIPCIFLIFFMLLEEVGLSLEFSHFSFTKRLINKILTSGTGYVILYWYG